VASASPTTQRQVRDKVDIDFQDVGPHNLKNIAEHDAAEWQAAMEVSGSVGIQAGRKPIIVGRWRRRACNRYAVPAGATSMHDMRKYLEKLHLDAVDCAVISKRATDPQKKELFDRLADHLAMLASELERAIGASATAR
jgi:hypothetical protein